MVSSKKIDAQQNHRPRTPPHALRSAARTLMRAIGADVVWLAVRESRADTAVIRCAERARSASAVGCVIEPGRGVGGAVLRTGELWIGDVVGNRRLSHDEAALASRDALKHLIVVPLRTTGFRGQPHIEGIAYAGSRRLAARTKKTLQQAQRIADRVARGVRDAQRVAEVTRRWEHIWAHLAAAGEAADDRLDRVAQQIAADIRTALRSGIGIVFRLDPASGALHSLGIDGEVIPGEVVPAVRRGQVLPPGSGCAGRAVALGKTFIASNYASDCIAVTRLMADAVASLPTLTTMSSPLIFRNKVVGALTVGRIRTTPFVDYSKDDVRLADQLAQAAAPLLARAQRLAEHARRERGASALSRLAESLTQSLSVAAVSDQLTRSVVALVRGESATIWSLHGGRTKDDRTRATILRDPKDPRLEYILEEVSRTRHPFWTPDLANDPRLALSPGSKVKEPDGPRAVLVVPVRTREALLALLGVAGNTGRAFTEADVELVQALADQAALGIANARAYNELQISNVQLLRHEKLVAMGRLTSGLAHEIRNPLQNVVALTSELLERTRTSLEATSSVTDSQEYVRRAHGEAKRAADIVDRLLDHMRERTTTLDPVDLRSIVTDAVAIVQAAAGRRGAQVTLTNGDAPVIVRADTIMLRQVILNLANNALDAVDGAGHIDVRTTLTNGIGPRRAVVTVTDSGRGIAPDDLPRVFDLFFTTKDAGSGVGLGLSICQSFIEQHGGTIRVDSPGLGRGTVVEFELPALS